MFLSLFFKKSVLYNKVHYLQLKDVRDKGALGIKHCWKIGFEKNFLCVGEYTEYGFDQQTLIWFVCRLWDMVFS